MNLQLNIKMMLKWYIKSSALQMLIFTKKIRGTLNAFMFTRKLENFFQNHVEHYTCFVWACLITVDIDWNAFYALDKK